MSGGFRPYVGDVSAETFELSVCFHQQQSFKLLEKIFCEELESAKSRREIGSQPVGLCSDLLSCISHSWNE